MIQGAPWEKEKPVVFRLAVGRGICEKGVSMEDPVVIIGAGVAGLCAADRLRAAGCPAVVLEATGFVGGRVRAREDFADFPIELGAEEVHGADNVLLREADRLGLETLRHFTTDDMMRLDGGLRFLDQAERDPDVRRAFDLIDGLGRYAGPNVSVQEHLTRDHFPRRAWHYLDSRLGVEHGTTLDRLAMGGFLHYERGWEARETNYTLRQRYFCLFEPLLPGLDIRLRSPVDTLNWTDVPRVRLGDGRELTARAVLVTVSLRVLREGGITFDPPLPPEKVRAMNAIGMDPGMKIVLKFRHRFWDERMYFLHTDGFLPQYWATGNGKSEDNRLLTAFLGGARAEALGAMGVDPLEFALGELDEIFRPRLASRSFEDGFVADWGADPHVRGLYSYPTIHTTERDRVVLAAPLDNKVFFAGEATDTAGHSGTVHGAMETGRRAAEEILARTAR
jgi:Monoamine oxidase